MATLITRLTALEGGSGNGDIQLPLSPYMLSWVAWLRGDTDIRPEPVPITKRTPVEEAAHRSKYPETARMLDEIRGCLPC